VSIELKITGQREFFAAARRLREAGHKVQADRLEDAVRRAAGHIEDAVREHLDEFLPDDYARVVRATMVFRTEIRRSRGARATLRLRAPSPRGTDRQIRSLEDGELKHPVFGRTRRLKNHAKWRATTYRNPWSKQKIRPHFYTGPATGTKPKVDAEIAQAMHEVAQYAEGNPVAGMAPGRP